MTTADDICKEVAEIRKNFETLPMVVLMKMYNVSRNEVLRTFHAFEITGRYDRDIQDLLRRDEARLRVLQAEHLASTFENMYITDQDEHLASTLEKLNIKKH